MNQIEIEQLADGLAAKKGKHARRTGKGFISHCPIHDDENASLSLALGDGKLLCHCQAGCDQNQVFQAIKPLLPVSSVEQSPVEKTITAIYPYRNPEGELVFEKVRYLPKRFAQRRPLSNGSHEWNLNGVDKSILYRLPEVLKNIKKGLPIFVVEGEKDADNLANLDLCATCNSDGASKPETSPKWTSNHAKWLEGASEIIVLPDNDPSGHAHARAIANSVTAIGLKCKIVTLPKLKEKGDVSDWLADQGTKAELLKLVESAEYYSQPETSETIETTQQQLTEMASQQVGSVSEQGSSIETSETRPYFEPRADGIWHVSPAKENHKYSEIWICSPLEIVAATRDDSGENWGLLLAIKDREGTTHEWCMPSELLRGGGDEYRGTLLNLGLRIAPGNTARNLLTTFLQSEITNKLARCVTNSGWHHEQFVMPDGVVYGKSSEVVKLQTEAPSRHGVGTKGKVEEWQQNVAKLCSGNSRLLFALSAAFAAPLIPVCDEESGGLNFRGGSSIGKTTSLRMLASVYGSPEYLKSCRGTANGLEAIAAAHNHLPLILDEIGQADPREAGELVYLLGNGKGKQRATKFGGGRNIQRWETIFVLSGEKSLSAHMDSAGYSTTAGQEVRLIDIPADTGIHGIFEALHGYASGAALAQVIKEACGRHYGTVGAKYLDLLCEKRDQLAERYRVFRTMFLKDILPTESNHGQVQRVAQRFAFIAFAGELATQFGLTGWLEGEATAAAKTLFALWLDERGGHSDQERTALLAQVRLFFEQHGASRFQREYDNERTIINRAGIIKGDSYFVFPETFKKEVIKGFDLKFAIRLLKAEGMLIAANDGGPTTTVRMTNDKGTQRCYRMRNVLPDEESLP